MTASVVLDSARHRAAIGATLLVLGAPFGALAISLGAPETTVYYAAFVVAAIATIAWLSRTGVRATPVSVLGSVLLVEDEPVVRQTMMKLLAAHGALVHAASSWPDAIAKVERSQNDFDVVILDVKLPRLSGVDPLAMLRRWRSHLSVVLVEAVASTHTARSRADFKIIEASAPPRIRAELEEILSAGV